MTDANRKVISRGFDAGDLRRILWSFLYGVIAYFVIQAPGLFNAKNYDEAKALVLGLVAGCITAGCSAVKNYFAGPRVK